MKGLFEKTINRKGIVQFFSLLALILFLASCGNVFNPPVTPETSAPPAGKGRMRLHLFDGGRTLRPDGVDNLSLVFFKLEFFSEAGKHAPLSAATPAGFSGDIELEAGSWTISLSGYSDAQGTALEAQGQAAVEIAAGRTSSAVLKLEPAGTGVFDYAALRSSLAGKDLIRAALALTSLRDNSVQTVDLLDGAGGGTLSLSAGYYRLAIDLYQSNAAANAIETAHILNGRTTSAPFGFDDFTFIPAAFFDTQDSGLAAALVAVSAAATDGANFVINLAADEEAFFPATLSYNGNRVTITLMGQGAGKNRVKLSGNGSLFTVDSGVTLIVKDLSLEGKALGFDRYDHLMIAADDTLFISEGGESKPVFANTAALITVNSGTLILENGSAVRGNLRYPGRRVYGSGIEVNGPGVCILNGGEISGNCSVPPFLYSSYGGGIGITAATGKLTVNSGTVCKNGATYGGGIYSLGDVIMNGGLVSENFSRSLACGGVYIGPNRTFTMNGGTISKNKGSDGGGIFLDSGAHFTLNDGLIESNTGRDGGGIYCAENTVVEIKGGVIRGNYSSGVGGGICGVIYSLTGYAPAQITISGGIISGNGTAYLGGGVYGDIITMTGGLIAGNESAEGGGGVYGTLILSDGEISGNKAPAGGGVHGAITMTGGKIINNIATKTAGTSSSSSSGGGGVYIRGNNGGYVDGFYVPGNGSVISGGEISGNQALGRPGGGIYVDVGSSSEDYGLLTLQTGALVKDNYSSDRGGGVYVNGGTLHIEGGVITHNETATNNYGAGVYIIGRGSAFCFFTMTDGEISWNKGWSGIYATAEYNDPTKPSLNISGGSIKNNGYDGILMDHGGGDLTMTGGTISGNGRYGIAPFGAGTIRFDGGEISGNSGGGMYTYSSECSIIMTGGVIKNNGGSGISTQGPLTISGGEISGNTAYENGGGVFVQHISGTVSVFVFSGGVIKNNSAPKSGGGIYAYNSTALMQGGEISGNSAGESGGGVYVHTEYAGSFAKAPAGGGATSGVIYGGNAGTSLGNNAPIGAALYWNDQSRSRSAALGAGDTLTLSKDGDGGYAGWD
jgi:hypothetical protein